MKKIYLIIAFVFISNLFYTQVSKDSLNKLFDYIEKLHGDFNKTYALSNRIIAYATQYNDTSSLIKAYQRIGDALWYKGVYGQSEDYYFKSLQLADSLRYPKEYAYALYSIGWIECVQKEKREKIYMLKRALTIHLKLHDTVGIISTANGVSAAYGSFANKDTNRVEFIDSAINYLKFAIKVYQGNSGWEKRAAQLESNLAEEYFHKKDYKNAYEHVNNALSRVDIKTNKRVFLNSIITKSRILLRINKPDSSFLLLNKYLKEIEEYTDSEVIKEAYNTLYKYYKQKHNNELALQYLEKYNVIEAKFNQELLSVKYEEMDANYQIFKKEQKISELTKQNELYQLKERQKTFILIGAIVIILLVSIFLFNTIRQNRYIKKLHADVSIQKKLIEEKNKDITDSINYASRIQTTLLIPEDYITQHFIKENIFSDYFILYKPKDIVSGDFYWAFSMNTSKGKQSFLSVCDSTGHGVPGAFMSLLNINFLYEAVSEKNIYSPHEIFNYIRNKLMQNLSYDEKQKDGMDGILIHFDESFQKTGKIFFAAANNPLIIIRKNTVIELAADKMPIGWTDDTRSFSLNEFNLEKNDWVYVTTDGYKDQFGGPKNKRLMYKNLTALLKENAALSAKEQKQKLETFFLEWKGSNEQIDDVCILGFKV